MTTETVLTDEQINEILAGPAGVNYILGSPVERFRLYARAIEQAVLQAYESQLLRLLVNIRFAAGDDGKRMQDELVEHITALRKDAERYRHLRDEAELCPHDIFNAWWLSDHGNPQTLDAAIDAAMEQKP